MDIVSVVIPIYYGNKYLDNIKKMIDENQKQLDKDGKWLVELILVNDSPSVDIPCLDEKWKIVNNGVNVGIHQSRVNGLNVAIGSYVLFLDQDDCIEENYLRSQLAKIADADAVVCNGYWKNNQIIYDEMPDVSYEILNKAGSPMASPGQVLIKRSSIPEEWLCNIIKKSGADDYLLWIIMVLKKSQFVVNNKILYTHIETGENASRNWAGMADSDRAVRQMVDMLSFERKSIDKIEQLIDEEIKLFSNYAYLEDSLNKMEKDNIAFEEYWKQNRWNEVIIYGYGLFGTKLGACLLKNNIKIKGIVDQHAERFETNDIFKKSVSEVEGVNNNDLIIITPLRQYDSIMSNLESNEKRIIISIKAFVDGFWGSLKNGA